MVTETTWHHTQRALRHDGSVTLSFRVDGLDDVVWWVLGWTGRAEVVGPPGLRAWWSSDCGGVKLLWRPRGDGGLRWWTVPGREFVPEKPTHPGGPR
jgi:hypothetical protein